MAKPSGEQIELNALQLQFLADLNRNWAASGALQQLVPTGSVGSHPFWPEVYNLCDGRPASFPFFVKDTIYWCLLAGNERTLQSGISALRAWIIPSFGWEETDSIASSGEIQKTTLAQLMLQLSPVGFFRWKSSRHKLQTIIGKLADIRRLERSKPEIVVERVPSLLELRQQFKLALATGDFQTAKNSGRHHKQI